ncbi:Uncharacterized protein M6B38_210365 [Iris pallida]|uniref:Uncharacterized protein n=1 Tax=Iris pallida TaxID=29817 RepID=A0AAX6E3N7_IRIPA|nr:Uncharacterized protein M6B38_210365 [Iris pallida]
MMVREGDDSGMRTVESLRGRLLAEREASKASKNEADLITKRLGELERKLAKEIKSRNRAQKRLEYALKKLKSMTLSNLPESSPEGWEAHPGTATGSQEGSWSSVGTAHSGSKDKEPIRDEDVSGRDYQGLTDDVTRNHATQLQCLPNRDQQQYCAGGAAPTWTCQGELLHFPLAKCSTIPKECRVQYHLTPFRLSSEAGILLQGLI